MNNKATALATVLVALAGMGGNAAAQDMQAPQGFSGSLASHLSFQRSTEDRLRGRAASSDPKIADHSGRFQNFLGLRYRQNDFTGTVTLVSSQTIGGGAFSLTNPGSNGVNFTEYPGGSPRVVDATNGIWEAFLRYDMGNTMIAAGKLDTTLFFLADPVFAGDFFNGVDYANAATRVVAPPFPSLALVVRHKLAGTNWTVTGIVGDTFGDRETLKAGKNVENGDLAYVGQLDYQTDTTHVQLTYMHVDGYAHFDKEFVNRDDLGRVQKVPSVNGGWLTASHWFTPNHAGFARIGYADGAGVLEDFNVVAGLKIKHGQWSFMASQSATRIAQPLPFDGNAKAGDWTLITELVANYEIAPLFMVGLTYNHYHATGDNLLAKDGGLDGARDSDLVGIRMTKIFTF